MIKEIPENEIMSVYAVLKELRPHITEEEFSEIYHHARKADDYTFYGYFVGPECVGLMGLRYINDYVHRFHLYIDDLVVSKDHRSQQIGAKLLKFAETLAQEKNCTGLRLCTGVDNKDGMRFYEREHWALRAVAYKKKV
ncbi:GNAT family N-acetyltransferase [bacterium]|nr:GNAT family N-acetyltransferase [bacterium]